MDPISGFDIRLVFTLPPRAQNLRQGIFMKTSFKTRVSRMGLGSFININIFVIKYYFFSSFIFSIFFESLKSKSTQMLGAQKQNSGVSFNDTLLNFGLRDSTLQYKRCVNLWNNFPCIKSLILMEVSTWIFPFPSFVYDWPGECIAHE